MSYRLTENTRSTPCSTMQASPSRIASEKRFCCKLDELFSLLRTPADYLPKNKASQKIKKGTADLTLELVKAPDILSEAKGNFIRVGFSAETENMVANAKQKLESKQLDMIAANDVTAADSGFGVDTNRVTLISRDGKVEELPLLSKRDVADRLLDKVVELLVQR